MYCKGFKNTGTISTFADSHRILSLPLRYVQNTIEGLSHSRTPPLPQIFYHHVASNTSLLGEHLAVETNKCYLPELQLCKKQVCHWMIICGRPQAHSFWVTQVQKHPIHVHVLHSLSLHFRPDRVWHVLSHVINRVVIMWSAKVGIHMPLEHVRTWKSRCRPFRCS